MTGPNGQEQLQLRQSGPSLSARGQFASTMSSSAIHGINPLSPLSFERHRSASRPGCNF